MSTNEQQQALPGDERVLLIGATLLDWATHLEERADSMDEIVADQARRQRMTEMQKLFLHQYGDGYAAALKDVARNLKETLQP